LTMANKTFLASSSREKMIIGFFSVSSATVFPDILST